jgi:LysM repeat protein
MEELPYARYVLPALLVLLAFGAFLIIVTNGSDQPAVRPLEVPGQAAPNAGNRKATSVTVRAGENAAAIARRVGITVDRLRELNPGVELDALHPGQRLRRAR